MNNFSSDIIEYIFNYIVEKNTIAYLLWKTRQDKNILKTS